MVNASLNWASIVGIVLAVGGAVLYFVRNFKPALARDYDVFFAAVGLLCGGILFFQGWRLDPILQFGQFLLAGSAVFFAYESVRLRGVTTEFLLAFTRRVIPPIGGVDVTPVVWVGLISLTRELLVGQQGLLTLALLRSQALA